MLIGMTLPPESVPKAIALRDSTTIQGRPQPEVESCASCTGRDRRTSSAPSGWCSTRSRVEHSRYLAAALDHLRATEGNVRAEDAERLSPLRHDHINLHGRYFFTPSDAVIRGQLRGLRSVAP
jgi:hypothetical protein